MTRIAAVCLAAFLGSVSLAVAQGSDPTFDAKGFQKGRDTFSALPFEHVDAVSGNLILTFTDFVLPGNAGFELRFQRTFNSKSLQWTLGWAGLPLSVSPAEPTILPNQGPDDPPVAMPMLKMADGGERRAVWQNASNTGNVLMTEDFWRYDSVAHTAELPNGLIVHFDHGDNQVRTISEVTDPFGNTVTFSADGQHIEQNLGNNQVRSIDIATTQDGDGILQTVTYLGRQWTYRYVINSGIRQLTSAEAPGGAAWKYRYTGLDLTGLTTPSGGTITYEWTNHGFWRDLIGHPGVLIQSQVIKTRTVGPDRGVTGGVWTYKFDALDDNMLTVDGPVNTIVYHTGQTAQGRWMTTGRTVKSGTRTFEDESWAYEAEARIAVRPEIEYHVPLLSRHNVKRYDADGTAHVYETTLTYRPDDELKDFGQPRKVTEQGELIRETTFDYEYDFTPFIRQRVKDETITAAQETFNRHYNFNRETGFLEGETVFGIHTDYGRDDQGNRQSATDAHGHKIAYSYEWGTLKNTTTPVTAPAITISREINPDGTVASVTRRGFKTRFSYDGLGRVRSTTPAKGHATIIDYATDGSSIQVSRGPEGSQTTISLDGFGRKIGTSNMVGVKTSIDFDAEGRKVFESYPFSGSDRTGTKFEYDALGRLTRVTHADDSFIRYDYSSGIDVTITDEDNHATTQDWSAFGNPSDARLMAVTDAEGQTFSYTYNGLGRLTKVNQPGAPVRKWTYFSGQDLLKEDTQPESGTISFTYDAAGRLESKHDAHGDFTFGYDANDRLTSIDAPGEADDVTMIGYDESDNRTDLKNPAVNSKFTFDDVNRLKKRTDTVAGHIFETLYSYDDWDNLKRITYPSGHVADYDYDRENRLKKVMRDPDATLVAEVNDFFPWGQIAKLTYGNGIVETFGADARMRLGSIAGGPVNLTYKYDDVGNVKKIADARADHTQEFGYDALDRLKTVTGFGGRSFDYDALGNRKKKTTPFGETTYTYNDQTLRLEVVSGGGESDAPTYDNKGNLRTSVGVTYSYTPFDMVRDATVIVGSIAQATGYAYDGDNTRFVKQPPSGPAQFTVHGTAGQLLSEFDADGPSVSWKRDYLYLGSRMIAAVSAPQATVGFEQTAVTVQETGGSVTATVVVRTPDGQPLKRELTVQIGTIAGSAIAVEDFTAQSATFTFAAGTPSETRRTFTVSIVDDTEFEDDEEQFTIGLSSAIGGAIVGGAFTVTIVDNDPHQVYHIDEPVPSSKHFTPFIVGGWVFDGRAASGTGVDRVTVVARGTTNGVVADLGPATLGVRPDIGATYGAQFAASGFTLPITTNLPPDEYDLFISAHYVADGLTRALAPVHVTIEPSEILTVDAPVAGTFGQQFVVTGWAIDREGASGTGVDQVVVQAHRLDVADQPTIDLGPVNFGDRTDVGTQYGARFTPSGFGLIVNTLLPGTYEIKIQARSVVSGPFSKTVTITLKNNFEMNLDVPTVDRQPRKQSVLIGGWAIDKAAPTGTGIDRVDVKVYRPDGANCGTGAFIGEWVTNFGPRPDIAATHGARFEQSGFGVIVNSLLKGTYRFVVTAQSTFGAKTETRCVDVAIESDARMAVDAPAASTLIWANTAFHIGGWAADLNAAAVPGVSSVDIWALPTGQTAGAPVFLGQALYGAPRQDVATALGRPDLVNVGFGLNPAGLPAGTYTLRMSLFSTISNAVEKEATVNINVQDPRLVVVASPVEPRSGGQAFAVSGYAIDRSATSGTGVSQVHVTATPVPPTTGNPVDLGNAVYGSNSGDAAVCGSQFAPSGFLLNVTTLKAGTYRLDVTARSAVTGVDFPTVSRTVTITSTPITQIDAPGSMQTTGLPIILGGWAIDTSAATTTGVDYVDAYAQLSTGGAETYLGRANFGDRPDIAATYGAQFRPAGFGLAATLPSIGTWIVKVKAHSALSGNLDVKTVTIVAASNPRMAIETPVNNSLTGQPFTISGWGIDLSTAAGTGADTVHVWATPANGGSPVMLGASYGIPRDNVAAAYGPQFRNSGFSISASGLAPGSYVIVAHLHSTVTGDFTYSQSVTVTVPTPHVLVNIDAPAANTAVGQPFALTGWAIDTAHPTAVGVSMLHIYAYPATGGPPVFLGVASTGGSRPDVGGAYGSRFTPSGWGIMPTGLSPGWYNIVLYPFSTVTQDFRWEAVVSRMVYVAY